MDSKSSQKILALPFEIVESGDGIILTRGSVKVVISGERANEVLQTILETVSSGGATREDIYNVFSEPDREVVSYLIDELMKRRMLIPFSEYDVESRETELDVFYWQFGEKTNQIANRINSYPIVIMGINKISEQLSNSLSKSNFENFQIVDYPLLRSVDPSLLTPGRFPKQPIDYDSWKNSVKTKNLACIVATSESSGFSVMRVWNEFCIKNNCAFFPIVLHDLIGYVGPLVIPCETACYECFLSRRKANSDKAKLSFFDDDVLLGRKKVIGYHPSMTSILGDIATLELLKFCAGWVSMFNVGRLIKMNMIGIKLSTHKILRVPRCRICSPLNKYPTTNLTDIQFLEST